MVTPLQVGTLDPNVYSKYESFGDVQKAQRNNNLAQQAANLDLQTKGQLYQTQLFSAAGASGDPNVIAAAKAHAADVIPGFDPSLWSDDPAKLQAQSAIARQALLNPYQTATLGQGAVNIALKAQEQGPKAEQLVKGAGITVPSGNAQTIGNSPVQADQGSVDIPQKPTQVAAIDGSTPAVDISQTPTQSPTIAKQPATQVGNMPAQTPNSPNVTQGAPIISPAAPLPPYNPRSQITSGPNAENNNEYKTYLDKYDKQYNMNNAGAIEQIKASKGEAGKLETQNAEAATKGAQYAQRLNALFSAMRTLNDSGDLPDGGFVGPETKAQLSRGFAGNSILGQKLGNGALNNAIIQWTKLNGDQLISEVQQFVASGGANTRINQTLDKMIAAAKSITLDNTQQGRKDQLDIGQAALNNLNVSGQNIAGAKLPYQAIPVDTSAPKFNDPSDPSFQKLPSGSKFIDSDGTLRIKH